MFADCVKLYSVFRVIHYTLLLLVAIILLVDLNPCTLCEWPVCMQLKAYSLSPSPNVRSEGC